MNNIPYIDDKNFTEVMGVTNKLGQQRSIQMVELDDIKFNPLQPRKIFQQKALEDLAASIAEHAWRA